MFPFQKIFTLLIRTFSRPMLGYVKRKQIEKPGSRFAGFFIGLGRRSYTLEYWVNHRILKTIKVRHAPELKQEVLLEKGIETFYEILFYLIVLGLPFWELYKSSIAAQKKEETLQKRIANLEKKMGHINQKIGKIVDYAKEKSKDEKQRTKQRILNKAEKNKNIKQRQQLNSKLDAMGQATISSQAESISEKIEELFENAIEVVADEFEDSLDEIEFDDLDGDNDVATDEAGTVEPSLQGVQIQGEQANIQTDLEIGGADSISEVNVDDSISVQADEAVPIAE